jgi:hypothetical protein
LFLSQLKTSAEAAIILEQSRALQGIPKTERELKAERGKVWSRLFFSSLLLSLLFNAIDTGSDILIMIRSEPLCFCCVSGLPTL